MNINIYLLPEAFKFLAPAVTPSTDTSSSCYLTRSLLDHPTNATYSSTTAAMYGDTQNHSVQGMGLDLDLMDSAGIDFFTLDSSGSDPELPDLQTAHDHFNIMEFPVAMHALHAQACDNVTFPGQPGLSNQPQSWEHVAPLQHLGIASHTAAQPNAAFQADRNGNQAFHSVAPRPQTVELESIEGDLMHRNLDRHILFAGGETMGVRDFAENPPQKRREIAKRLGCPLAHEFTGNGHTLYTPPFGTLLSGPFHDVSTADSIPTPLYSQQAPYTTRQNPATPMNSGLVLAPSGNIYNEMQSSFPPVPSTHTPNFEEEVIKLNSNHMIRCTTANGLVIEAPVAETMRCNGQAVRMPIADVLAKSAHSRKPTLFGIPSAPGCTQITAARTHSTRSMCCLAQGSATRTSSGCDHCQRCCGHCATSRLAAICSRRSARSMTLGSSRTSSTSRPHSNRMLGLRVSMLLLFHLPPCQAQRHTPRNPTAMALRVLT